MELTGRLWPDALSELAGGLERVRFLVWARLLPSSTNTASPKDPPLTLAEAAALVHKSEPWVRRKAAAGQIPCARRVGRSWVFPREELLRHLERVRQLG